MQWWDASPIRPSPSPPPPPPPRRQYQADILGVNMLKQVTRYETFHVRLMFHLIAYNAICNITICSGLVFTSLTVP